MMAYWKNRAVKAEARNTGLKLEIETLKAAKAVVENVQDVKDEPFKLALTGTDED